MNISLCLTKSMHCLNVVQLNSSTDLYSAVCRVILTFVNFVVSVLNLISKQLVLVPSPPPLFTLNSITATPSTSIFLSLQLIQNSLARAVVKACKSRHISLVPKSMQWNSRECRKIRVMWVQGYWLWHQSNEHKHTTPHKWLIVTLAIAYRACALPSNGDMLPRGPWPLQSSLCPLDPTAERTSFDFDYMYRLALYAIRHVREVRNFPQNEWMNEYFLLKHATNVHDTKQSKKNDSKQ